MYLLILYTLFWFSIEYSSKYIWNIFFKEKIKKLPVWEQKQFYTKTVAFCHAVIVSYMGINILCGIIAKSEHDREIKFPINSVYFINEEIKNTILITMTYFIWDIVTCFKEQQPFDVFLHAFVGFFGSYIPYHYHVLPIYVIILLSYEISTPFLNLRWFLIKLEKSNNAFFTLIQNFFGYSFVFFRVFIGFCVCNVILTYDIYNNHNYFYENQLEFPFYFIITIKILSDILNLYWTVKILNMKKKNIKKK
jgi:hypothetical protein